MMDRGWYNAKDLQQQIRMDIQNAQNVLSMQDK
jgi:spore coat protein CotF